MAPVRDDCVLGPTRVLATAIVPFLVVAFVVLYGFPDDTERLFAWTISPPITPMTLGAVYLGGSYFFVQAARSTRWHSIEAGFVAVALFATMMGVATIIHWDRFNHEHVAFWLWAGLYFTTPFLVAGVWLRNRRRASPPQAGDLLLSSGARRAIAGFGAVAVAAGLFLFLLPEPAIDIWPWALTPLTARVMGAIFMLGVAGLGVTVDPRWSAAKLMLQVQVFMMALILLGAARARADLDGSNPMTWLLLGGFFAALVGAAGLIRMMDRRGRSESRRATA